MGFWFTFFLWAATFVLSDYFRARLPSRDPDGVGDFRAPTATQGRPIPQIAGGTVRIEGTNCLWYGDWDAEPVTVETGIIFTRDETVGYKYRISAALGQFIGQCAGMTAIYIGDDKVFDYVEDAGGVPQTVVDINLPELFGGERSGGGFIGRFRCFTGEDDQPQSAFLADPSRIGPLQSHWPGMTYVVMSDSTETRGAEIGESNQLRDIRIEFQTFDTIANGGLGDDLGLGNDHHIIGRDANPISVAYRILNNPDWSIATSNINTANFQAAAETVFDEGLGYSRTIDSETNAFEVLAEIEKHIDGYIGPNPVTGFIEVKLARDDYTPATEFQAGPDNILAITDYAKPDWPETKNDVKVRFVNRDKNYSDDHAVAQDMANRIITGRPSPITLRFEGVRDATVANIICARASRAYFWPLAKFKIEMDRSAEDLRPGDVVIVNDEDIGAVDMPVRVTRVSIGDAVKQSIVLDVVEDVFRVELGLQADPPPSDFVPPDPQPVVPTLFGATIAPEWLLVKNGETVEPRLLHLVGRDAPNQAADLSWQARDTFGSGSYNNIVETIPSFTLVGTLRADLPALQSSANNGNGGLGNFGAFEVDGTDLFQLAGTYNVFDQTDGVFVINPGQPNQEFVAAETVTTDATGILCEGVIRGVDSPFNSHLAGDPVFWLDRAYVKSAQSLVDGGGYRYQLAGTAFGNSSAFTAVTDELEVYDPKRVPPAVGAFNVTGLGSALHPDGPWPGDWPQNSTSNPVESALELILNNRDPDQLNPVYAADGREDDGSQYPNTDVFGDFKPQVRVRVYDLDKTPNPTRDDVAAQIDLPIARLNGSYAGFGEVQIKRDEFWHANFPDGGPINARLEFTTIYPGEFDYDTFSGGFIDGETATDTSGVKITIVDDDTANDVITYTLVSGSGIFNNRTFTGDLSGAQARVNGTARDLHPEIHSNRESPPTFFDRVIEFAPEQNSHAAATNSELLLRFDEADGATQATDYGKNNFPVTFGGLADIDAVTAPATGLQQGVLRLSGSDYIEIPDDDAFNFDDAEGYCIQFRIQFPNTAPTSGSGVWPIFSKGEESTNNRQFRFQIGDSPDGRYTNFAISSDGTTWSARTEFYVWSPGQWYTMSITVWKTGSDEWVYTERDNDQKADSGTAPVFNGTSPLRIGADQNGNTLPDEMLIDEFRIVRFPLGRGPIPILETELLGWEYRIPVLFNFENGTSGAQTEVSDDLNQWTATMGATTALDNTQSKFGTQSMRCDGVNGSATNFALNDGASLTGSDGPQAVFNFGDRDFTMEGFVRFAALPSSTTSGMVLISKYRVNEGPGNRDGDFYIFLNSSDELVWQSLPNGTTSEFNGLIASSMPAIAINTWYHFAVVREGDSLTLLWEGDRVGQDPTFFVTNPEPIDNRSEVEVMLGRFDNSNIDVRALDGWLDSIRIDNGQARYDTSQTTYTVPTSALTLY